MRASFLDFSTYGRGRVWGGTLLGTIGCIAAAFAIDSYSWSKGEWELADSYINNLVIPVIVAPPLFYFLLSKVRQLAVAHRELMIVASTDALTNCLNRHAFMTLVDRYLDRIARQHDERTGSLLVIDIDRFKRINDTFGHDCGDIALRAVAGAIKGAVRELDVVGRIGGEEFGVLLPGATEDGASKVAERIRREVFDTQPLLSGEPRRVSVSVGGAMIDSEIDATNLFRLADQRLYAAKRGGRNRVVFESTAPASMLRFRQL